MSVNIFSDVLLRYEDCLIEKNLVLIDTEIKNENNQASRIIARRYGEQSEKESDKTKDLGEELADVIFVVLCLANQTGVDLQSAFDQKMKIKSQRDHLRHQNNSKLK